MPARGNNGDPCDGKRYYAANPAQADILRRLDGLERRGDRLSGDISRARETPWAILISGLGVLLLILISLSGIYLQWINSEVEPLEKFVNYNFGKVEKGFDLNRQDREEIKDRIGEDIALLRAEINELRSSVFPLEVHRQRWEHYDLTLKAIEDRIRETNERIAGLYSPADKFKELQTQLDQLREIIDRKFVNGFMAPPLTNGSAPQTH